MMEKYFGIKYQFDKLLVQEHIHELVEKKKKGYICVADGVTLTMTHRDLRLKNVLDHATLTICDSGWVPLYLRMLYGIRKEQYSGADLMNDIVHKKKYRMMFLGSSEEILNALKKNLSVIDNRISGMTFVALPFCSVDAFEYVHIADEIKKDNPDIIWISLGMPKQEFFMHNLEPFLDKGVLIGVGAAFKFHSGLLEHKRAPQWMIRSKMEWVYRIWSEPKKQLSRCSLIIRTLPKAFIKEYKSKRR